MSSVLDKVSLACRVQHHPSRAPLLDALLPRLGGLDPQVITDPGGKQRSTWRTHRLCLESIPDDATHLLCVQDDAWPCDGFAEQALTAIEERPDRILCFFVSGIGHIARSVALARKRGERWFDLPPITYVPVVAVVYPAEHARAIPAFADKRRISVGRTDDAVIATYTRANRVAVSATLPCLVEHLDSVPSVLGMPSGRGAPHRLAAWFVQTPSDASC